MVRESMYNAQGILTRYIKFQEIKLEKMIVIIGLYIVEEIILFICGLIKYLNIKFMPFRGKIIGKKNYFIIGILLICTGGITGCNNNSIVEELFMYSALDEYDKGETSDYYITLDYEDNTIWAQDKKTGERFELTRDAFEKEYTIQAIFVNGEDCYYLTQEPGVQGVKIYGINIKNFYTSYIYGNQEENLDEYINLSNYKVNNDIIVNFFFLNQKYIYYIQNQQLIQINRRTNKKKVITDEIYNGYSMYYYNNRIYYVDLQQRLCIYTERTNKIEIKRDIYTNEFEIDNGVLRYKDLLDDCKKKYFIKES